MPGHVYTGCLVMCTLCNWSTLTEVCVEWVSSLCVWVCATGPPSTETVWSVFYVCVSIMWNWSTLTEACVECLYVCVCVSIITCMCNWSFLTETCVECLYIGMCVWVYVKLVHPHWGLCGVFFFYVCEYNMKLVHPHWGLCGVFLCVCEYNYVQVVLPHWKFFMCVCECMCN